MDARLDHGINNSAADKYHCIFTYWLPECCRSGIEKLFRDPYERYVVSWHDPNHCEVNVPINRLKPLNSYVFDSLARVMTTLGDAYTNDIEISIFAHGTFKLYKRTGRPQKYKTPTELTEKRREWAKKYQAKRRQLRDEALVNLAKESEAILNAPNASTSYDLDASIKE